MGGSTSAGLEWIKLYYDDYVQTFQPNLFTSISHHDRHPVPKLLIIYGLGHGCVSQGQQKAKPVWFSFSHTSQVISMKFDVVLEQNFSLNILISL